MTECPPQRCSHRQPGVRPLATPERNVIFERQKIEQNVNAANEHGAAQQIQIGFGENALHLVHVFFGESEFLQRYERMLHVQYQTQLPNANWCVGECQRQLRRVFGNFDEIVDSCFQKVILQNGQYFVVSIYSEEKHEERN